MLSPLCSDRGITGGGCHWPLKQIHPLCPQRCPPVLLRTKQLNVLRERKRGKTIRKQKDDTREMICSAALRYFNWCWLNFVGGSGAKVWGGRAKLRWRLGGGKMEGRTVGSDADLECQGGNSKQKAWRGMTVFFQPVGLNFFFLGLKFCFFP